MRAGVGGEVRHSGMFGQSSQAWPPFGMAFCLRPDEQHNSQGCLSLHLSSEEGSAQVHVFGLDGPCSLMLMGSSGIVLPWVGEGTAVIKGNSLFLCSRGLSALGEKKKNEIKKKRHISLQ